MLVVLTTIVLSIVNMCVTKGLSKEKFEELCKKKECQFNENAKCFSNSPADSSITATICRCTKGEKQERIFFCTANEGLQGKFTFDYENVQNDRSATNPDEDDMSTVRLEDCLLNLEQDKACWSEKKADNKDGDGGNGNGGGQGQEGGQGQGQGGGQGQE